MKKRIPWIIGCCLLVLGACQRSQPASNLGAATPVAVPKAKNVILMIGDGMAISQISAAMYSTDKPLALEQFPVIGMHKSYCYNDLVTDSAAGATAFSCGVKTLKFALGVNKDTVPCRTILEEAEDRGMATGIVVTSTIVHATPAAFYAHQTLRAYYEAIAVDLAKHDIDFIIGGGRKYFDQRRPDGVNLLEKMRLRGYDIFDFRETPLEGIETNASQKFIYFTGDADPVAVTLGRQYLPYASELAANFLRSRARNGFFLMVEGSQIDWAGHSNDAELMVAETLDFDQAVGRVLKFAQRRPETLVIVTGDHETGGLGILPESKRDSLKMAYLTNEHTPVLVPVFAYGPGAELFAGIYENTQIYTKMRQALGWEME